VSSVCIVINFVVDLSYQSSADWNVAREVGNNALTNIPTGGLEQINNALAQARI
jgi:hypothetical protein